VSRRTVIAYWLIPSEPAYSFFQEIINDLARRYDAPVFDPHVTVHVGGNRADSAKNALAEATRGFKGVTLKALGVDHSDEFIKTLFVEFALNAELRRLSNIVRSAAHDSSQYELKPHLSLLYKNMAAATRRELAASIKVPFSEISFNGLKGIRCISPTLSRADVESWRIVKAASLSS
jgi:2'-5' RNA ligase